MINTKSFTPQQNTSQTIPSNPQWHGKPYYSLDAYCKNTLQHKCYKIALNAHMTCPNRDGSLGTRGCIFCSTGGSGDFAVDITGKSVSEQLAEGLSRFQDKFSLDIENATETDACLIAYFQAYTNTYAPVDYLRQVYTEALDCPLVCGISIATRPDCMQKEVLHLLQGLQKEYPHKFIWIELGLQTVHDATAAFIRRGYPLSCFEDCMKQLQLADIPTIVHIILGLPGENKEQMLQTIAYINRWKPFGVKLQLLHVLKNTDLVRYYENHDFDTLSKEAYLDILTDCLTHLSPDIVVHRVTGDGPKDLLIAPMWSSNKRDVLNSLHRKMREENLFQGKHL